jgi:ABC-type branched-subunit amino acid transport system substrate-binding protein
MKPKPVKFLQGSLLVMLIVGFSLAQGAAPGQLTAAEKRGKLIYLRGSSASGREITAFLGGATTEIPASAMPCANCHRFDGRGNPEGGVTPADITWETLTKHYGVTTTSGRKRPPYTERALELAITRGIDPAGNELSEAMPRYWMSREDLADLVAYIKRLSTDRDVGLTDTSIRLGTLVPGRGPTEEMGRDIRAALEAYFEEINAQGGIYNRRIELHVSELNPDPKTAREAVERFVDDEQIFAMAGGFIAGADKEIASALEEKEVVMVGPTTLYPDEGFAQSRHIFYLLSGLKEQSRALVNFIADKLQKQEPRLAILCPETGSPAGVIEAIEEQCQRHGYRSISKVSYSRNRADLPAIVNRFAADEIDAVFFLGSSQEAVAVMNEAAKLKWTPCLLSLGSLIEKEILEAPLSFSGKIFASFPMLPLDQTVEATTEFRALAQKHNLSPRHLAVQLSAYSAAKVLVEGLKRSGRELSREKLIAALEGLYNFDTGLTPRVTYGPNRRVGALGAYVVTIDLEKKQFITASGWITPE